MRSIISIYVVLMVLCLCTSNEIFGVCRNMEDERNLSARKCVAVDLFYSSPAKGNEELDIVGLILARGGSKGIPGKNLEKIQNQTLLHRTLEIMQRFGRFSSVWVSTDDRKIAEEAQSRGAYVHSQEFCSFHSGFQFLALVQCTSPFLRVKFLEQAYQLMVSRCYDSVFSVTREFKLRWMDDGGEVRPVNFDPGKRPRRQDWRGELVENGMFYFVRAELVGQGLLQGGRSGIVEVPKSHSLEVDTQFDLRLARVLSKMLPHL
ncbi:N-acylneuraminate cytidylyltransferase A [Bacillus rossius redtenbacheri]|uniref:N-acylneuraminate cytidylyltransferase A n=1 Tax=Bacillus rossius redtenbacheri TaxID=93214 RepID=UPI002FDC7CF9